MANKEYINPEGLRMDGRRPDELRKIRCKLGIFARSDGSAYIEQGNTKVLVAVYGPREVNSILFFVFQLVLIWNCWVHYFCILFCFCEKS